MTTQQLIERDLRKLRSNIRESERQMEFTGVRLGVFAELRRLERERKRIARRLIERDPESRNEYAVHLQ
jgi:hypothetical protein